MTNINRYVQVVATCYHAWFFLILILMIVEDYVYDVVDIYDCCHSP